VRSDARPLASTGVGVVVPIGIGVLLVAFGTLLLLRRRVVRR
jgi:LPXTG-motif cell wall-anchored protein